MVTFDRLREILRYEDGNLIWTKCPNNQNMVGRVAGRVVLNGYRQIMIDGELYYAHVLVWLYHTGHLHKGFIDHIDNDVTNNRIENLRIATRSQNMRNRGIQSNNTTGVKGVTIKGGKFYARITVDGGDRISKYFTTMEEAKEWIYRMRELHHGEFANHGLLST